MEPATGCGAVAEHLGLGVLGVDTTDGAVAKSSARRSSTSSESGKSDDGAATPPASPPATTSLSIMLLLTLLKWAAVIAAVAFFAGVLSQKTQTHVAPADSATADGDTADAQTNQNDGTTKPLLSSIVVPTATFTEPRAA